LLSVRYEGAFQQFYYRKTVLLREVSGPIFVSFRAEITPYDLMSQASNGPLHGERSINSWDG
jgi:hypothetical protein